MLELFMIAVIVSMMTFVACDAKALLAWSKGWRIGAILIGSAWVVVNARIAIDLSGNPTSHNMWPFEVLIWSGLGLLGLGVLAGIRSAVSRERVYS